MIYSYVDFYKETYEGSLESRLSFYLQKASKIMDKYTCGDIIELDTNDLSFCCCEIADLLHKIETKEGISSENNDGWSVSYYDKDSKNQIMDILKIYIPVEYLYRGYY